MKCSIRKWKKEDSTTLAAILNNKKILDNLRDLPFPYTEKDAEDFIHATLQADENKTYVFAITVDDIPIGSIGVYLEPAPLSKPVNTFLNIPILYGFLQSPLPTILHPAGFLKKPVLCVKACLEAMLLKTGRLLI